ncbi:MAG: hypothetical protein ACP5F6_09235 [Microbacter sp.]
MDFTLTKYQCLLIALRKKGYDFRTVESYFKGNKNGRFVLLRHDVDACPECSLRMAEMEHAMAIQATYYFRIVAQSNQPEIIRKIVSLGHEIGYHYEDLTLAKGDFTKAVNLFDEHLRYFRTFYPVQTICMHGSPMFSFDNRDLWKRVYYRDWQLLGEPYFDINFHQVGYLTDTGRRWNDFKSNRRDRVNAAFRLDVKTTDQLIEAIEHHYLPDQWMMTTHPQRWTNHWGKWITEWTLQQIKNPIKRFVFNGGKGFVPNGEV